MKKKLRTFAALLGFLALTSFSALPALAQAAAAGTPSPVVQSQPSAAPAVASSLAPGADKDDRTPAQAAPASPAVTPETKPLTLMTPNALAPLATQLGQTLQTLVGIPSSKPTLTAIPALATPPTPGQSAPAAVAPQPDSEELGQEADSFTSGVLDAVAQTIQRLKADSNTAETNLNAFGDFTDWLGHQASDPHRQALWSAIGSDLTVIIGIPLLVALAVTLILSPLRVRLRRQRPERIANKASLLGTLFAVRAFPVILFVGASLLLLDQNETHRLPRFVILNIIYAVTACFAVRHILRTIFMPGADHLRLFNLPDPQAFFAFRWLSAFSQIIVFSYFFVEVASAVRVPQTAIFVAQNAIGLVLTIMAITVIIQTRVKVALIIRGNQSGDSATTGPTLGRVLRAWLARHWHSLTIAYLVISYVITILGIDNGVALMLRGTILTFIILVGSRLLFLALDRWTKPTAGNSALVHRQVLSFLLRPFIWVIAVMAIAATWGFRFKSLLSTTGGQRVTGALMSVGVTLFVLTVIYELINSSIDRHLGRRDTDTKSPVASARARTLLPMMRNTVFMLFSGAAILTMLSAVGVNIAPLLAGAGVVGVAIGFGSQSLVKDFLTGLFIVVENTVAVGDVVTIGAFGGVVEALSIRTIRLRDVDGSLHILPFSEVSKITNMTKGYAYALVDVGVAYDTDIERAMQVLRDIGAKLQEDPIFKRVILEPIEVMGIETMGDFSITLRSRIRTRPGKQWDVKRLLLLNVIKRFAAEGIEIPFPTAVHLTKRLDAPGPGQPQQL
jgi:small-conductance mechanosensitive channel